MPSLGAVLAEQLDGTRDWTNKLLADFAGDDWSFAPGVGLAHATWLCGHLAVSQNLLIHVRCLGNSILADNFAAHFQMGRAVSSTTEYAYPPIAEIRATLDDVHRQTVAIVRDLKDDLLAQPAFGKDGAPHPHYNTKRGAISHADRHEAFHAGQLALIRRLRGKSFLR